jgi:hypothetical protein
MYLQCTTRMDLNAGLGSNGLLHTEGKRDRTVLTNVMSVSIKFIIPYSLSFGRMGSPCLTASHSPVNTEIQ